MTSTERQQLSAAVARHCRSHRSWLYSQSRLSDVERDTRNGASLGDALAAAFADPMLAACLRAVGLAPRCTGPSVSYEPLTYAAK